VNISLTTDERLIVDWGAQRLLQAKLNTGRGNASGSWEEGSRHISTGEESNVVETIYTAFAN
jgi:hypothetical protein